MSELGLNDGVGGLSGNTTLVVLVSAHHDVSLHSPASSPAVRGGGREGEERWEQGEQERRGGEKGIGRREEREREVAGGRG